MEKRVKEEYHREMAKSMQKLPNNEASKSIEILTKVSNNVPVNYGFMQSLSL